ncbi:rhodanese-like domain-containing protein [Geobacter anodireducens]
MKARVVMLMVTVIMLMVTVAVAAINVHQSILTPVLLNSGVRVIDIRTEKEWRETGIIKGSLCLTFFNEDKQYDAEAFLAKLKKRVNPNDKIAIVCRSGNRSLQVSKFLVQRGFSAVTNIVGGIVSADDAGIRLVSYH